MALGIPLNDDDRQPWLERLHALIAEQLDAGRSLIVASSALKESYRQTLQGGRDAVQFVHLVGDFDLIYARMRGRSDHYMKAEMLQSQFDTLEKPQDALSVLVDQPVSAIVEAICEHLDPRL